MLLFPLPPVPLRPLQKAGIEEEREEEEGRDPSPDFKPSVQLARKGGRDEEEGEVGWNREGETLFRGILRAKSEETRVQAPRMLWLS